jgi:hypothetical protein
LRTAICSTRLYNELRVFVPRSRRKNSVGPTRVGALLGAGRIWKFQKGGAEVEGTGVVEMAGDARW